MNHTNSNTQGYKGIHPQPHQKEKQLVYPPICYDENHQKWVDSLPENREKNGDSDFLASLKQSVYGRIDRRLRIPDSDSESESESEDPHQTEESALQKLFPFLTSEQISRLLEDVGLCFTPLGEEDFPPFFRPLPAFIEALKWMANEPRKNYSASEQLSSETLDEMSQRIHSKVAELAPEITSETSDCVSIIGALLVKEEYLILCHKSKAASDKAFFLMYFNVGPYHRKLQDRMEKPEDEDEVEGEEEVDFGDLDIYAAVWTACFKQLTEFVSEKERLFNGMSFDDAIKAFRKCI